MSTTADNKDLGDVRRFLSDEEDPDLPAPDAPLGQIALSHGYLSEAQLEECLEEQKKSNPWLLLGEILLRRKLITSEQLLRMLAAQKKKRPATAPLPKPVELPEGARIGKYLLVRELGRGGMGVVYEAEDPDLHRRVAVKVLKDDASDPTSAERLRREAAIAAQLRHPGIVAVHEVGTTQSLAGPQLPFIVMDLIQGRTLEDVLEEGKTARPDLLRILEDVARAVGYAHLKGVVHRDLKPNNVLIEESGRVMLSDFGIARAPTFQSKLTETRLVVGTPEFMAPEQIDGTPDKIGPASDVYALGVMTYRVLTGRPPFQADTPVKLFQKILGDEPPPPRRFEPRVEKDLEIICLKALEKVPARRYPTGEAFAEDLRRFRRGEPVLARPAGTLYRWGRRISRRRVPIGIAVAGLLLSLAVGWSFGAWARRERALALEQLQGRLDTTLRAALGFRREGNLERMRAFAKEAEAACADAILRFPDQAEPYALQGRMYRAQMETGKALAMQDAALALNPFSSTSRYERVVLTSRLYRKRTDELVERAWRSAGERLIGLQHGELRADEIAVPSRSKLAKGDARARALRAQMETDLRALGEGISEGERLCARGLLAWLADELAAARGLLTQAIAKAPHLEEAYEALATLELEAANYEASIDAWTRGLEQDKGYLPHLEGRGTARMTWGHARSGRGEDPAAAYEAAVADFTELIRKDPARDSAHRNRGLVRFLSAHHQLTTKLGNPQEGYQAAVADLTQALQLNPRSAETRMWRGLVRAAQSITALFSLQDATPMARSALEDLTEAIKLNPDGDEAYLWRALARLPLSIALGLKKSDPEPLYHEALADFEQALRKNPGRAETWMWRGVARSLWASYLVSQGRDPRVVYRQAMEDLDIALAKMGGGEPLEWRGRVLILLGDAHESQGDDSSRAYEDALNCFEKSLGLSPKSAASRAGRGHAWLKQGAARARRGQDPTACYDAALKDLTEAAASAMQARTLRAELYVRRGQHKAAKGESPDADYQAALADAKKALEGNLFDTDAWIWQGRARALQAPGRVSPLLHLQDAIGDFNKVLFFNPEHAQALAFRGDAFRARGIVRSGRIVEAIPEFQSALADYEHALKVQPGLARELKDAVEDCRARLEKK